MNVTRVVETFVGRWRLEATFAELHAHLGLKIVEQRPYAVQCLRRFPHSRRQSITKVEAQRIFASKMNQGPVCLPDNRYLVLSQPMSSAHTRVVSLTSSGGSILTYDFTTIDRGQRSNGGQVDVFANQADTAIAQQKMCSTRVIAPEVSVVGGV